MTYEEMKRYEEGKPYVKQLRRLATRALAHVPDPLRAELRVVLVTLKNLEGDDD